MKRINWNGVSDWFVLFTEWLCVTAVMVALIVIALLGGGCAINHSAPIVYNKDFDPLRICVTKPTLTYSVYAHSGTSDEAREAIHNGVAYWNGLTEGAPLFVPTDDARADVMIYVDGNRPYMTSDHAIGNAAIWAPQGCTALASVWLDVLESGDADYFETIVRHELGHVLGLGHRRGNFCPDLMCDKIEFAGSMSHPQDVDGEHLNALRELYPERIWRVKR